MSRTWCDLALAAVVLAWFPGCGKSPGPKASLEQWMVHVEKCDKAKIMAGITSESVTAIEELSKRLKASMQPEKAADFDFFITQICKGFKPGSIEIGDEEVTGDNALVRVSSVGGKTELPLKLEGGKWKLDFKAFISSAMKPHSKRPSRATPADSAPLPSPVP